MDFNFGTLIVTFVVFVGTVLGQLNIRQQARWCNINEDEMAKCERLVASIEERMQRSDDYPFGSVPYTELPQLSCILGAGHFDCMEKISRNEADLIQLDAGLGYTAGEYFTMMPIMAEKYSLEDDEGLEFYSVAVVRRDNPTVNINTLNGKKACHPMVGHAAGWVYPISTLIEDEIMPITECNVPVKSASAFFGEMCAPNGLARFYNPFGNNPASICANCKGSIETYCMSSDPFADYDGAFRCMAGESGDVAFVRDHTVMQAVANSSLDLQLDDFQLLCRDGSRRSPTDASSCNWGKVSSHIVMTSAIHGEELRQQYKQLLKQLDDDFGTDGEHNEIFSLYSSGAYSSHNIMFSDVTKTLVDVATVQDAAGNARDTYYTWVGEEYRRKLEFLNTCPLQQARWCVISANEMMKCENMIMAFAAKGLKPDLNCIRGRNVRDCMDMIRMGDADLIALDSADVYVAGKSYGLVPIAAEDYSGYEARSYYSVAVARRTEAHLTIFNLKSRRSCHSGVMTAAGWITPVDKLIETGQIHVDDCDIYHHVGQFFSKSCVPGALNEAYNTNNNNPINLCEACASGGPDRCQRNDVELYYGNSGAFRCLTEFGGDIAFVKHTTVRENTDGRNQAEWARNRRSDDYQLLCNDGTRRDIDDWQDCNNGEIPANAIVTADFKSERDREIYWTLLNYAQQFFASDSNEDFQMFHSMLDHKDLIFQDSTVRLVPVEPERQNYESYLGPQFVRAMERMTAIDCVTGGASTVHGLTRWLSLVACFLITVLCCIQTL